jgi:molybdopterin-guanine dinucleotide biosynthesis protein A
MGRDKALIPVDGIAMAARVGAALEAAGVARVFLVGAQPEVSERLGLVTLADRWPGAGPLGGTATALLDAPAAAFGPPPWSSEPVVVVASCDQPDLSAAMLARLVNALSEGGAETIASVPRTPDGRRHPFPAAWRASADERLGAAVARGERRAEAAWAEGRVVEVLVTAAEIADLDTPTQVAARTGTEP